MEQLARPPFRTPSEEFRQFLEESVDEILEAQRRKRARRAARKKAEKRRNREARRNRIRETREKVLGAMTPRCALRE